ncbi:MAG: toxin-activating lysine-acyltransferase, partial [Pseudomonadota bacterium]
PFGEGTLLDAFRTINSALDAETFAVYLDEKGRPTAGVLWAWLSEECAERYVEEGCLRDRSDWTSGNQLWLIYAIASGDQLRQVAADFRGDRFAGHTEAFMLRPMSDGTNRVVRFTRKGANLLRRVPKSGG